MKQNVKKIIAGICAITMLCGAVATLPADVISNAGIGIVASAESGSCGANLTYTLEGGVLTIKGEGTTLDMDWWGNQSITTVVINASKLESIPSQLFYYCLKLEKVDLSNATGLKTIDLLAFAECTSLTTVDLSNATSLTTIGDTAFQNCTSLKNVDLSNATSLTTIGMGAFQNCTSLATLDLSGATSLKTIESGAFGSCTSLATLNLSNATSLTTIENGAFGSCTSLATLDLLKATSLKTIGQAFLDSALEKIWLPASVTSIDSYAFMGCEKLKNVYITCGATAEQYNTINGMLKEAEVDESKISQLSHHYVNHKCTYCGEADPFGGYCGAGDTDEDKQKLEWKLEEIEGTTNYKLVISGSGTTMADYDEYAENVPWVYYKGSITSVDCSSASNLKNIGISAFRGCSSLTSIEFPKNVTSIGNNAFRSCSSLASVTIPKSVTSLGSGAFSDCTNLGIVDMSEATNLNYFGGYAFSNCKNLETVIMPATAGVDFTTLYIGIFQDCTNLKTFRPSNSDKSFEIPSYITSIDNYCFHTTGLTDVTIPKNVKELGKYVFAECSSLKNVEMLNPELTLLNNEDNQFYGDNKLATFKIACNATEQQLSDATTALQSYANSSVKVSKLDHTYGDTGDSRFTCSVCGYEYSDKKAALGVDSKINDIGTVEYTSECKDKIDAARNAYAALTNTQKGLVTKLTTLEDAEEEYNRLKINNETAQSVDDKIAAIGEVVYTEACNNKIKDARDAYDALTQAQKDLVTKLATLEDAENEYAILKENNETAQGVDALIDAIGKVKYTTACNTAITEARAAYEALSDDQKALVTKLDVLEKAEKDYAKLKAADDKAKTDAVTTVLMQNAFCKPYIYVCDANMNVTKTFTTRTSNAIKLDFGKANAGKTVTIYEGKKSTKTEYTTVTLDANGKATVTVENGKNYTAIVD